MRFLAAAVLGVGLAGCVPAMDRAPVDIAGPASSTETIFVASIRAGEDPDTPAATRAAKLHFSMHRVAVPPGHRIGVKPGPMHPVANPQTDFRVVQSRTITTASAFSAALANDEAATGGFREALVFVHGFNVSFAESLTRMGQVGRDFDFPGTKVLFAWPSDNSLFTYHADQRRVAMASGPLRQFLKELAASRQDRIVLVGYSMGALAVLDAVAGLRLDHASRVLDKIDLVLLSPDLGIEEFRRLAGAAGPLRHPIIIYGAFDDVPLKAASIVFNDGRPRLGALSEPQRLADVRAIYVDVGNVGHHGNSHFAVASAPPLIQAINAMEHPDLVAFAAVEAPAMAGAKTRRYGKFTYVLLPKMAIPERLPPRR